MSDSPYPRSPRGEPPLAERSYQRCASSKSRTASGPADKMKARTACPLADWRPAAGRAHFSACKKSGSAGSSPENKLAAPRTARLPGVLMPSIQERREQPLGFDVVRRCGDLEPTRRLRAARRRAARQAPRRQTGEAAASLTAQLWPTTRHSGPRRTVLQRWAWRHLDSRYSAGSSFHAMVRAAAMTARTRGWIMSTRDEFGRHWRPAQLQSRACPPHPRRANP